MVTFLNEAYWTQRYANQTTGWDAGAITTPLKEYVDQLVDHQLKILIPGAGNAHEARYMHELGFRNLHVLDISAAPLRNFKAILPDFPDHHLHHQDFFGHSGKYDLILEQTFFCAIDPELRKDYAIKVHELLKPGGKLVGVLWSVPMNTEHPPFGGTVEEYDRLFSRYFRVEVLGACYNSIKPRAGKEAFIKLRKDAYDPSSA